MSQAFPYRAEEEKAAKAFDRQSGLFDELFSGNPIIQYKRQRVRTHVNSIIQPSSNILELNSGTGDDAIYFASLGHILTTTDISSGMQKIRMQKILASGLESKITDERCSFTSLDELKHRGPYDHIFSNFGGLNCTKDLTKVLDSFYGLLKPKGAVTLVIMPRFTIWELGLILKGKWKTALRRFSGKQGSPARIEGEYFTCWYYNPSLIIRRLRKKFQLIGLESVCLLVPPSYMEYFPAKYPRLYSTLIKFEKALSRSWPWNRMGDYFIISLRKRD
jgi:ubiquinone/menaquinone biosynthesis C-methylase UbiE